MHFVNKIPDIHNILQQHRPDVLCISEANINTDISTIINHFLEHNIELNLMYNNIKMSRNAILINKNIS